MWYLMLLLCKSLITAIFSTLLVFTRRTFFELIRTSFPLSRKTLIWHWKFNTTKFHNSFTLTTELNNELDFNPLCSRLEIYWFLFLTVLGTFLSRVIMLVSGKKLVIYKNNWMIFFSIYLRIYQYYKETCHFDNFEPEMKK